MSRVGLFCTTPEDTTAAGAWLGRRLEAGQVVLVEGILGAGKTTFIQGLAEGYGLPDVVTSPTFALIHVYGPPEHRMIHVDPYRIEAAGEAATLGLEDYIGTGTVVAVEWPARLAWLLPDDHIHVWVQPRDDEARIVTIEWHTMSAAECCAS